MRSQGPLQNELSFRKNVCVCVVFVFTNAIYACSAESLEVVVDLETTEPVPMGWLGRYSSLTPLHDPATKHFSLLFG